MKVSKLLVVTIGAIGLACLLGLAVGLSLFTVERPLPPFTEPSLSRLGKYRTAAVSSDGVPCSEIGRLINILKILAKKSNYKLVCYVVYVGM